MRLKTGVHPFGLGIVLTLAACGDGGTPTTTDSASGGSTAVNPSEGSGDASEPTATEAATSTGDGGASESASAATTGPGATATTGDATEGVDETGTGDPSDGTTGATTADATTDADTTDADTGDTTGGPPAEKCEAPAVSKPCDGAGDDAFKAIGVGCTDDPKLGIPIENPVLKVQDKNSWRVATRFGSGADLVDPALPAWAPREGERFLVIGTGLFAPLDKEGALIEEDDDDSETNANPDGMKQLPGVMKYQVGSNDGKGGTPFVGCDLINDCSDTLDPQWNLKPNNAANDVFYMSFQLTAPAGTHGYMFDFVYFSEEWPYYVDTDFNDMLIVWSTSETFTGNVTFIENQPLTVTALDQYLTIQPGDARLAGTGFPGDDEGAATGWFTAKASAAPGEKFTVAISIFDMGDTVWDTVGILDNFRWDCMGCVPSEVDSCGLEPQ